MFTNIIALLGIIEQLTAPGSVGSTLVTEALMAIKTALQKNQDVEDPVFVLLQAKMTQALEQFKQDIISQGGTV